MGSTFTRRLYLGSGNGNPSIYSVTGDPSVTPPPEVPNPGDLALSDNGTLYVYSGSVWVPAGTGVGVAGPGSATDNALARFDGGSGALLQGSSAILDDAGNLSLNAVPTIPVTYAPQLKLYDANFLTPEYVAIAASNTMAPGTTYSLAFPPAAGAVNEALTTDGSGNLIWQLPIFSGGSAGGSLTGTYPSPGIAAGAIGASQIANGAVNIGKLAVNVVNNYLPSTTEKQAMAGTSGTPGPTNQFFTQEGGTFTPPGPGPAYSVTDPVSTTTTYSQAADGAATLTPAATAPAAIAIAPVSAATSAFTVTDPATSVTTVDQKPDGTVIYTNPTNINNTTQVSGDNISVTNVNKGITIAGDSTTYTYNAAPSFSSFFQYVLNQPISVNVSMLDTGDYQLSETDSTVVPATTGRLAFSAVGSSTAGTGVSIASYFDDGLGAGFIPAELTITASSLRFTGDLAPNDLPGTSGYVLTSQGAGVPPVWADVGIYTPTTSSDWTTPTPSMSAPTATGQALDLLAAQNLARWQNTRTTRKDTASSTVVTTDQSISVVLVDATANAVVETLPAASTLAGKYYTVKKIDSTANTVTVQRLGGNTIDGQPSYVLGAQYSAVTLVSDGDNWYLTDFQTTPGTASYVLTSAGAGASPTWTAPDVFLGYSAATPADWTTPTPLAATPTYVAAALDRLAAQNLTRWQNLRTIRTDSGNSTVVTTDQSISVVLVNAAAGARTETLPAASALTGKYYTVKKIDASGNTVTVLPVGGNTIDGQNSYVLSARYAAITLISDGSNWLTLDFQTTPGTSGQLLTSSGAGASPTWTSQSAFTNYTPANSTHWTTPTPVTAAPTTISTALNTLAEQNYTRWVNYRTTESRLVSSNAIVSDNSVSAIVVDATAGPVTITLPNVATWANKWFTVKKVDASANAVILASGGANIDGSANQSILYQYDAITVVSTGGTWYILDQIDSAPPVVATAINISMNGSAVNGAPTFVGGFYVPTGSTFTTSSRVYMGVNAAGTISAAIQNTSNATVATFSYVAASSGFFDVTLAAPVTLSAGWYNVVLTAGSANTTAFIRGLYMTV